MLKKKVLFLAVLVSFCYILAFLKLPFVFLAMFLVTYYTVVLFFVSEVYLLLLPKETCLRYREHQIKYLCMVLVFLVFLILGRSAINNYFDLEILASGVITTVLLVGAILLLGRSFLVKVLSKKTCLYFVVCCLLVVFSLVKSSFKAGPASGDSKGAANTLQTLGYVSWAPVEEDDKSSVTMYDRQKSCNGFNLYASKTEPYTYLMDMQGNVLHKWFLEPGGITESFFFSELMENGDLLSIAREGKGFVKLGWDSRVKWETELPGHHDFYVGPNGDIYVLARKKNVVFYAGLPLLIIEDYIVVLDSNGTIKDNIPLYPIYKKDLPLKYVMGIFKQLCDPDILQTVLSNKLSGRRLLDKMADIYFMHTNTVEIIHEDIEGVCGNGDIIISSRDMSLVGIFNVQEERFVWSWGPGDVLGQHQPTLLDNGNLLMLDNGWNYRNYSRVIELDLVTKEIEWEYAADPKEDFFSVGIGGSQRLPNGNTLVTEGSRGRIFEITKDGEIVWEFYNPNVNTETKQREVIYRMTRITNPENYPMLQQLKIEN